MPRLVHVSDLHFGRLRHEVLEPLRDRVRELQPDLVVVSGDLTQRARRDEFEQARSFVTSLSANLLVVPGNHDVPLWNAALRLATPLRRWRRAYGTDPEPVVRVADVLAVGLCSAHGWTRKHGRLTKSQRHRLGDIVSAEPSSTWKMLVVHHPLVAGEHVGRVARGAGSTLACLARAGVDLILCGHEHRTWSVIAHEHAPRAGPGVLVIHAGTATSDRHRGEDNSFNLVEMEGDTVAVTVQEFSAATGRFEPRRRTLYEERRSWRLVEAAGT